MALSLLRAQPALTLPPDEDAAAANFWLVRVQWPVFATERESFGYTTDGSIQVNNMVRGGVMVVHLQCPTMK